MSELIRWEDPPAAARATYRPRGPGMWELAVAAELRTRPGQWALVGTACAVGKRVPFMRAHGLPRERFEITTRRGAADGPYRIYARYIGAAS